MTAVWVGGFGVLGVVARFCLDRAMAGWIQPFPISTFLINVVGSFLIGVVTVLTFEKNLINPALGTALAVGFLGGFTTFSAYALQITMMIKEGAWTNAFAYWALTPLLAVGAAYLGVTWVRGLI